MDREAKPRSVLLVEDSEEDIFFFKRAFSKSGVDAEVLLARDGKTAIEMLSNEELRSQLAVIFLDLKLPLIDGFEVLRWVRSRHSESFPPITVLSGSSRTADKDLARELGAHDYVVKPIQPQAIRTRVHGLHPVETR